MLPRRQRADFEKIYSLPEVEHAVAHEYAVLRNPPNVFPEKDLVCRRVVVDNRRALFHPLLDQRSKERQGAACSTPKAGED